MVTEVMEIVLATNNQGKARELHDLLAPLNFKVYSQQDFAIPECAELGSTFVENAVAKARHASKISGLAAIADDSGLIVPALDNQPGVHSARYAGDQKDDAANIQKLLTNIKDCAKTAFFYTVIVFMRTHDDPSPIIAEGKWEGEITLTPRGTHGFGYDSCFYVPALSKTAAELSHLEKNQLSHRAKALSVLKAKLQYEASD